MWTLTEMRIALAQHDIGTVFRIMQRHGLPQREIAALTGITQSEVSEVLSRRRKIQAYTVLDRLVEGLQLPRGWAGLVFDDETALFRDLGAGRAAGPLGPPLSDVRRPEVQFRKASAQARRRTKGLSSRDGGQPC